MLMPNNMDIYTLAVTFPFIEAPILSVIFGIIIGLFFAFSRIKTKKISYKI